MNLMESEFANNYSNYVLKYLQQKHSIPVFLAAITFELSNLRWTFWTLFIYIYIYKDKIFQYFFIIFVLLIFLSIALYFSFSFTYRTY